MSTRAFKQRSSTGRDIKKKKKKNEDEGQSILSYSSTYTKPTQPMQEEITQEKKLNKDERAKSPITIGTSNYDQSGFVTYFPKNSIIMKPKLDDPNILHKRKVIFAKSITKCNENVTPITVEIAVEKNRIDAEIKASAESGLSQIYVKRVPWKQSKKDFYEQKSIYSQNEISHLDNLKHELSDDFFNDERNWTYEFTLDFANEINHHYKNRKFFPKVPYDKKSISIFTEPADTVIVSEEKLNKLKSEVQNYVTSQNKPAVKLSPILSSNFSNTNESFVKKVTAPSVPLLQRQRSSVGASLSGRNFDLRSLYDD